MTQEQFNREKNYQVSLSITKAMSEKGVITDKEYRKIRTMLVEKYNPVIGRL